MELVKNGFGDDGAKALAKLIRMNKSITSLDLRHNKVSITAYTAIIPKGAIPVSWLEVIFLQITTMGASYLLEALQESNFTLQSLLLDEQVRTGLTDQDDTFSKLFNLSGTGGTLIASLPLPPSPPATSSSESFRCLSHYGDSF